MKLGNLILLVVAVFIQFHGALSGSADTCQMFDTGGMSSFFTSVNTFDTPFTQDKSTLYSFLTSQTETFIGSLYGNARTFTGLNFHTIADDPAQPQQGQFLYTISWFTNITIGLYNFFTPAETGEFTFSIDTASDAAALYIFDNQDVMCCDDMNFLSWIPRAVNVINIPTDPEHTTGPKSASLEAGKNYLFVIVYVNFSGDAELSISVTDPSGKNISDLGPYMTFPIEPTCDYVRRTSMIYSLGTDSVTSTYSTSYRTSTLSVQGADFPVTEVETIYYILTPAASSSSDIPSSSSIFQHSSSSELLTPRSKKRR